MTRARILVVDDKPTFLSLFEKLAGDRMDVRTASTAAKALGVLELETVDVVVTDIRMPDMDGVELLHELKRRGLDIEVILVTAYGTIPQAVRAMQDGAFSYLTKPFDPAEALAIIEAAILRRRMREEPAADSVEEDRDGRDDDAQEGSRLAALSYREVVDLARDRATREYLVELLRTARGNVTRAAQRARLERESLHRLMRRYHLRAEDFRDKA
ncbi:MAG: response regulator [Polyangiaceae bacterium]|nr:response regulator [Polyangiaceae bacterium]